MRALRTDTFTLKAPHGLPCGFWKASTLMPDREAPRRVGEAQRILWAGIQDTSEIEEEPLCLHS